MAVLSDSYEYLNFIIT